MVPGYPRLCILLYTPLNVLRAFYISVNVCTLFVTWYTLFVLHNLSSCKVVHVLYNTSSGTLIQCCLYTFVTWCMLFVLYKTCPDTSVCTLFCKMVSTFRVVYTARIHLRTYRSVSTLFCKMLYTFRVVQHILGHAVSTLLTFLHIPGIGQVRFLLHYLDRSGQICP